MLLPNMFLQEDYNSLCVLARAARAEPARSACRSARCRRRCSAKKTPRRTRCSRSRRSSASAARRRRSSSRRSRRDACRTPVGSCTPLDGRYVVNLVSVHFDHFEAVISRIDKPFSFQLSDSDELWLSWFAYGFAQPATGGEQGEIDEAYNEPLRPLLHTLPARAAGDLRRSQPSEALRPVRWRGARQPALAALRLRREGRRGPRALPRLRRAVGGGRAAPAVRRRQGAPARAIEPAAARVGIAGAPRVPADAKMGASHRRDAPAYRDEGRRPVPAPNLDTTLQKDVPPPKRPPVAPKRGEKGL